jgi:hypothetical protein
MVREELGEKGTETRSAWALSLGLRYGKTVPWLISSPNFVCWKPGLQCRSVESRTFGRCLGYKVLSS